MATDEAGALRMQFKICRIWPTYQEAIQLWALVNSRSRHDRNSAGQKMHEVTDQSDMVEDKFRCASKGIIVEGPNISPAVITLLLVEWRRSVAPTVSMT